MLEDIGTLAPSVIVAVACLVGVVMLVRHELGPKRKGRGPDGDRDPDQGTAGDQRRPAER